MTVLEFNQSVQAHSEFLKPFAVNLTRDGEDAKDLIQETVFKALSNKDKYRDGTNLKAWLYTIMKNIFINNYRKASRMGTMIDTTENLYFIDSSQSAEPNKAESKLVMEDLEEVINTLSDEYRIPFLMHYQGFKYQEIAERFNIPIGTVKSRIFLARQSMKKRLKAKGIERY